MADKPKTVTVEALVEHTAFGKSYAVGEVYEIDEAFVETVIVQGKCKLAGAPKVTQAPALEEPHAKSTK